MSSRLNAIWDAIRGRGATQVVEPQRVYHTLVKTGNTQERPMILSESTTEESPTVSKREIKTLLRIDGISFATNEKYVIHVVGPDYYFVGDKGKVRMCEEWAKYVRLQRALEKIVRTILGKGLGIAWIEVGWDKDMNNIHKLRLIDPMSDMDFMRDAQGKVKLDEFAEPLGYVQPKNFLGQKVEWTKDTVVKDGKVMWTADEGQDGRDFIAYFTLFLTGEDWEPIAPIETVYRDARARLNNSSLLEEVGFRGGGIVATVGDPNQPAASVPDSDVDKLAEALNNVSHQDVFVFKPNVKLDNFPLPDIKGRDDILYYFADVQCGGTQMPLGMLLEPKRSFKGETEAKGMEFERVVMTLQNRLSMQIEDKLLKPLMKYKGYDVTKTPEIKFRAFMPAMRLSRARRIGKLVKDGVIHWSPGLEKIMREEEGLPTDGDEVPTREDLNPTVPNTPTNGQPPNPQGRTEEKIDKVSQKVDELMELVEDIET